MKMSDKPSVDMLLKEQEKCQKFLNAPIYDRTYLSKNSKSHGISYAAVSVGYQRQTMSSSAPVHPDWAASRLEKSDQTVIAEVRLSIVDRLRLIEEWLEELGIELED